MDEHHIQLTDLPEDHAYVVAVAVSDGVGRAVGSGAGGTAAGGAACPNSMKAP
jgi:hypothetical protein